jgi:hypothetical protein
MSFSKHVVGIKTEIYQTAESHDYGGHWIITWIITKHTVQHELHATKGWRMIHRERKDSKVRKLPSMAEWQWRAANTVTFKRTMPAKEPAGDFQFPTEADRLRAVMRHRERRRDIQRATNLARMEANL